MFFKNWRNKMKKNVNVIRDRKTVNRINRIYVCRDIILTARVMTPELKNRLLALDTELRQLCNKN